MCQVMNRFSQLLNVTFVKLLQLHENKPWRGCLDGDRVMHCQITAVSDALQPEERLFPFEYAMTLLNNVVWLSVFPFIETICPNILANPRPKNAKSPSKTPLLQLPITTISIFLTCLDQDKVGFVTWKRVSLKTLQVCECCTKSSTVGGWIGRDSHVVFVHALFPCNTT